MTTTTAPAVNAHQPIIEEDRIRCAAPDCDYTLRIPVNYRPGPDYWADAFQRVHSDQHEPGRAPDITVDWEISASCSVCEDTIGDIVMNDSESVRCKDCGTTWDINGNHGERDEDLNAEEAPA